MSKIISLEASNIKRLSAVHIEPDGSLVVVGGKNGQGKTSVLDSIMYALSGGDSIPPKPLRTGTNKGQAVVTLDDGLKITRKFSRTQEGDLTTSLEIKRANGDRVSSPQALLDSLCGRMAFDPLEFSRLRPRDQLDALRELVGLDFSEQDRKRTAIFAALTETHRRSKSVAAELAACPKTKAPAVEVSVADLADELGQRERHNQENAEWRRRLDNKNDNIANAEHQHGQLVKQIAELQKKLNQQAEQLKSLREDRDELADEVENLADKDCEEIREQLKQSEAVNAAVRQNTRHDALATDLKRMEAIADSNTAAITAIDREKVEAMAAAKFPVVGLGFDESGITFNNLPFEQSSSAEQLRISVAMGLALNPKLPVMLIRDGSLLDTDSLAMVAQMAEECGAQVWMERVGEGAEVSVLIEDGTVAGEQSRQRGLPVGQAASGN